MNTKEKIVESIIRLPRSFYTQGDKSIRVLLQETGYFEQYNSINESDIAQSLLSNPDFIYDWLSWSEDKRVTSGWYFLKVKNDEYKVGYFPSGEGIKSIEFSNAIEAC